MTKSITDIPISFGDNFGGVTDDPGFVNPLTVGGVNQGSTVSKATLTGGKTFGGQTFGGNTFGGNTFGASAATKEITKTVKATTEVTVKAIEEIPKSIESLPDSFASDIFSQGIGGGDAGFGDFKKITENFKLTNDKLSASQIKIANIVDQNSIDQGLDVNARSAVLSKVFSESSFNPDALGPTSRSGKNPVGLLQSLSDNRQKTFFDNFDKTGSKLTASLDTFNDELLRGADPGLTEVASKGLLTPGLSVKRQVSNMALFQRDDGFNLGAGAESGFGTDNFARVTQNAELFKQGITQGGGAFGGGSFSGGAFDFSGGSGISPFGDSLGGGAGLDISGLQTSFDDLSSSMTDVPDLFDSLSGNIPNATSGLTQMTSGLTNSVSATQLATVATQAEAVAKQAGTTVEVTSTTVKGTTTAAEVGLGTASATAATQIAGLGASAGVAGVTGGGGGTGLGGGIFQALGSILLHKGGVVGREGTPTVSLPRFHDGLAPDEFRAVLKRNEAVFTPEQLKVLGVAMSSGGRDNSARSGPPTIINNFTTPDPDSFRRTESQVGRRMAREIDLASRGS